MIIQNSTQPYLFYNKNDMSMLYCWSERPLKLIYGREFYFIPWKIRAINLSSGFDQIIPTNRYHAEYGKVLGEHNPHIAILNNTITLLYVVAFSNGRNTPINYYYCSMDSEDYTFMHLSNFRIIAPAYTWNVSSIYTSFLSGSTFSHIEAEDGHYIGRNLFGDTQLITYPISQLPLSNITRISGIFNTNKLIITGKDNNKISSSLIIGEDYIVDNVIKNSYNYPVHKPSILDDTLAFTVKTDPHSEQEGRMIVIEQVIT